MRSTIVDEKGTIVPISFFEKKNQIPTFFGFSIIAFQIYREILKKNTKSAITEKKSFLDGQMRYGMPNFQSSELSAERGNI